MTWPPLPPLPALLALGSPPGGSGQGAQPVWVQLFPFILLLGVFFLIVILPQQKKARAHAELLKGLKNGDKVVTNSGIVGVIVNVKDHHVTLRSEDAKIEVLKSSVAEVTERKAA